MRLQQHLLVLIGKSNRNRLIPRQHAMSARRLPRRLPAELHRNHHLAQQAHQPAHRPHKPLRPARSPHHVLRPIDPRQRLRQLLGNHLRRRPSRLHRSRGNIFALRRRHRLQRGHIHARLLREGHSRRPRLPILERSLHRRPNHLLGHVLLPRRNIRDPNRQPPRCREALARNSSRDQPFALQHRHHAPPQLRLRGGDHPSGNFFQSDFKEKIHVFLS